MLPILPLLFCNNNEPSPANLKEPFLRIMLVPSVDSSPFLCGDDADAATITNGAVCKSDAASAVGEKVPSPFNRNELFLRISEEPSPAFRADDEMRLPACI